jgi:zinc transporter, ZIP family
MTCVMDSSLPTHYITESGAHYVDRKFGSEGAAGALGIVVGAVVDGVPESIIFRLQLASGQPISTAFIGAVFVSNMPQAIAPSADLATSGWNWRRVAALWSWVVLA